MAIIRVGLARKLTRFFLISIASIAMSIKGHCNDYSKVDSTLKTIPNEDQQIIKDLFYLLFGYGDFAYVFFDIKPMCSIDYTMEYIQNVPGNERFIRETHLARKGFDVWKKYQNLFPMNELKIQLHESNRFGGHFSFALINPKKCSSIIKEHLTLFQNYCGKELSAEEILELIYQGVYFQEDKNDATILGLLFGYPEKDVLVFSNYLKDSSKNKTPLRPCRLAWCKNPITPVNTPYFMTNRNETELTDIKNEYAHKKPEIVKFYYSEDFLKTILRRFVQ